MEMTLEQKRAFARELMRRGQPGMPGPSATAQAAKSLAEIPEALKARALDTDHSRAVIRQHHAGERRRADARQFDHGNPGQCAWHGLLPE